VVRQKADVALIGQSTTEIYRNGECKVCEDLLKLGELSVDGLPMRDKPLKIQPNLIAASETTVIDSSISISTNTYPAAAGVFYDNYPGDGS